MQRGACVNCAKFLGVISRVFIFWRLLICQIFFRGLVADSLDLIGEQAGDSAQGLPFHPPHLRDVGDFRGRPDHDRQSDTRTRKRFDHASKVR